VAWNIPRHASVRWSVRATRTSNARSVGSIVCVSILAVLCVVVPTRTADSVRVIDVALSRYTFSPERIEVRLGEAVRLNIVSTDGTHGFQVKALGLNVRIPARGQAVTIDLTPKEAGTFRIGCSEYCGIGHSRMQAWLIVTPAS